MVFPYSPVVKEWICNLSHGTYTVTDNPLEPNFLTTPFGEQIHRTRVMGTIVSKYVSEDSNYVSLTIDDTTGTIRVKGWREDALTLQEYKVGEVVEVLGEVREYRGEVYLMPELVVRVDDPHKELLRELELMEKHLDHREEIKKMLEEHYELSDLFPSVEQEGLPTEVERVDMAQVGRGEEEEKEREEASIKEEVKRIIADSGEKPVSRDELVDAGFTLEQLEPALRELLESGEIYEPRPGRYRKT